MLENPNAGIVEADEMDFQRFLQFQLPYLGVAEGYYKDWNPFKIDPGFFLKIWIQKIRGNLKMF